MTEDIEFLKNGQDALSFRQTINKQFNDIENNKCIMDDIMYISPVNYGDKLPADAKLNRVFFLQDDEET